MDLAETGANVIIDQPLRARHCVFDRQRLPGIGTKMIAAEKNPMARQPHAIRDLVDEFTKACRLHAGIASLLIDLVGGGFDQRERRTAAQGVQQRRFDHQRMRRADGIDGATLSRLVMRDEVENGFHDSPVMAVTGTLLRSRSIAYGLSGAARSAIPPPERGRSATPDLVGGSRVGVTPRLRQTSKGRGRAGGGGGVAGGGRAAGHAAAATIIKG